MTIPDWTPSFFNRPVVLDMWRLAVSAEQTLAEADVIEKALGAGGRWLDAPCGGGRHSLELARRGHVMTGIDISEDFIREAVAGSAAEQLPATFVHADIREMGWAGEFDGAFCFGNSFGYFDHAGSMRFLSAVGHALKPGARFALQTGMAAESLLPNLKERAWYQVGDITFLIANKYLAAEGCLETEATFIRDGKRETHTWWAHVFTVAEFGRMLEKAGLRMIETLDYGGAGPFKLGDHGLVLVAAKP